MRPVRVHRFAEVSACRRNPRSAAPSSEACIGKVGGSHRSVREAGPPAASVVEGIEPEVRRAVLGPPERGHTYRSLRACNSAESKAACAGLLGRRSRSGPGGTYGGYRSTQAPVREAPAREWQDCNLTLAHVAGSGLRNHSQAEGAGENQPVATDCMRNAGVIRKREPYLHLWLRH